MINVFWNVLYRICVINYDLLKESSQSLKQSNIPDIKVTDLTLSKLGKPWEVNEKNKKITLLK